MISLQALFLLVSSVATNCAKSEAGNPFCIEHLHPQRTLADFPPDYYSKLDRKHGNMFWRIAPTSVSGPDWCVLTGLNKDELSKAKSDIDQAFSPSREAQEKLLGKLRLRIVEKSNPADIYKFAYSSMLVAQNRSRAGERYWLPHNRKIEIGIIAWLLSDLKGVKSDELTRVRYVYEVSAGGHSDLVVAGRRLMKKYSKNHSFRRSFIVQLSRERTIEAFDQCTKELKEFEGVAETRSSFLGLQFDVLVKRWLHTKKEVDRQNAIRCGEQFVAILPKGSEVYVLAARNLGSLKIDKGTEQHNSQSALSITP